MNNFIRKKLLVIVSVLCVSAGFAQSIIPYPTSMVFSKGSCDISKGVTLEGDASFHAYFSQLLASDFAIATQAKGKPIVFTLDATLARLGAEGYQLRVQPNKIEITAPAVQGLFYGIQSIRQLIKEKSIACVQIEDQPTFSWRAFMLDEARHFKGKEEVKKLLDQMALLKMNVFHWHLTDDQGWRIEIKKYPLLTQIGAYRDSSETGTWKSGTWDGKPHGGFHSQADIKEIVAYASARQITVVPEIEMPGHAAAAIAAYAYLGTDKQAIKVPPTFGVDSRVFDVSEPRVYEFIDAVFDELATLFPSKIIHIGGDEVKFDQWKESTSIGEMMKKEGLNNYSDVHVAFTNKISNMLAKKGKQMMGWNEIMGKNIHGWSKEDDGKMALAKDAIVHFWHGDVKYMKEAIEQGHKVVNSWTKYTYLDYNYKSISLEHAYSFYPIPDGMPANAKELVLGFGCQMWSEWTPQPADIHRQIFPRIAALAEAGWTAKEQKNYARFLKQLAWFKAYWKTQGIISGGDL